jgi:glycosyltransferase involved in cell wall biosynthesis
MTPAVSVIIATYNYGRYLAGALDSALRQTFADLEVLVIDDGSTDGTDRVVQPYLADARVSYHRTAHVGQPRAKNTGIRLARAPLLAFLDADDLWLPRKLERQLALFRADPELGVAYSAREAIDDAGRPVRFDHPILYGGAVLEPMFRSNFICFSSAVVRRRVFDDVGHFDENLKLAIDYDLWLRAARRYRFDYVAEPLVKYRTGHASLSRRLEERLTAVNRIMQRFLDDGGRALLPPRVVRRARAETCYHLGLACRTRSRLAALPWYLRAVALSPRFALAWQGLFSLPLPEAVRRCLRRALGRPADWATLQPLPLKERNLEPCHPLGSF